MNAPLSRPRVATQMRHPLTRPIRSGRFAPFGPSGTFPFVTSLAGKRKRRANPAPPDRGTSHSPRPLGDMGLNELTLFSYVSGIDRNVNAQVEGQLHAD